MQTARQFKNHMEKRTRQFGAYPRQRCNHSRDTSITWKKETGLQQYLSAKTNDISHGADRLQEEHFLCTQAKTERESHDYVYDCACCEWLKASDHSNGDSPMVRCLDSPTRANGFADSCESPDSRELPKGSQTEPLFCESCLRGANRRFEAIRTDRSHVMKLVFFLFSANRFTRIASIRVANRRAIKGSVYPNSVSSSDNGFKILRRELFCAGSTTTE